MTEMLKLILSLTLSGSILALLILVIKPFVKGKVSKTFQYYIWLLVLLRLVFPFSFETSLINNLFYSYGSSGITTDSSMDPEASAAAQAGNDTVKDENSAGSILTVQQKVRNGFYNYDADHVAYLNDLLIQTALFVWLLGVFAVLLFHVCGYLLFISRLRYANTPAAAEETKTLGMLLDLMKMKHKGIKLFRNRFSTTPMLIGLFRPSILIPDNSYTPKQLESILRHELTHLRRWDIVIKWFSVIVASLHWFNPLMLLVKRELNRACELSCDERVIMDLNTDDRRAYGETLIAVVAERKYPVGVLSTTMCEEKKTLKERLTAIMNYRGSTKRTFLLAAVLLVVLFCVAAILGAGAGKTSTSDSTAGTAVKAGTGIIAIGTGTVKGAAGGELLSSSYYNLAEIAKHKTAYVGNNSKDMALVGNLPLPDTFFNQQYISLKTKEEPYGLTAYYEAAGEAGYPGEWPISTSGSKLEINSKLNALVLFAMIDNVEDITFAFRDTKSTGDLEKDTYDMVFSFSRKDIEWVYGNLTELGNDMNKLAKIIDDAAGKWSISISNPESQEQIADKIDKGLSAIMTPSASSNPGDYIKVHQKEYNEIVVMGNTALPYLKSILDSGDNGLRARIAEILIQDITE
jgi:beta-lactamase regulating signal transducer with metallopeptidase domain